MGQLTRREFRERMNSGALRACIIPVAATEQHLEHLAMEQDWRSVSYIAESVAKNLTPQVIVADSVQVGVSEHHMKHPGTLTLQPGTFLAVVSDLIESTVRAGFRNVVVLNGHGGNVAPINGIFDQWLRKFQINLHFLSYWDVLNEADAIKMLKSGHRLPEDLPGHAQEFETSVALSLFPENVRKEVLIDQVDKSPEFATPQTGTWFVEQIVDRLTLYLKEIMDGTRITEIPPFHP